MKAAKAPNKTTPTEPSEAAGTNGGADRGEAEGQREREGTGEKEGRHGVKVTCWSLTTCYFGVTCGE